MDRFIFVIIIFFAATCLVCGCDKSRPAITLSTTTPQLQLNIARKQLVETAKKMEGDSAIIAYIHIYKMEYLLDGVSWNYLDHEFLKFTHETHAAYQIWRAAMIASPLEPRHGKIPTFEEWRDEVIYSKQISKSSPLSRTTPTNANIDPPHEKPSYPQPSLPATTNLPMDKESVKVETVKKRALALNPNRGDVSNANSKTGKWNLVPNGDFENEMSKWFSMFPKQNPGRFAISTHSAFTAKSCVAAIPNHDFTGGGFAWISESINVDPDEEYVLSAAFDTAEMPSGQLYLDIWDGRPTMQIVAQAGKKGWSFVWTKFKPKTPSIKIRLVRDGKTLKSESGYIDCVGLTPAKSFVPPETNDKP